MAQAMPEATIVPTRGVLYIVWSKGRFKELGPALERSMQSVRRYHPDLGVHVHELPDDADFRDKSKMYAWTPFDETLFLDADTTVMGGLTYGFERAALHHVACCICEAPYARRYTKAIRGDVIEYNTGVLFFRKSAACERLFAEWERLAYSIDSSIVFRSKRGELTMACNDQGSFALAAHNLRFNPFVLPLNWNFRPLWQKRLFGPIKVWHDYTPVNEHVRRVSESMEAPNLSDFWVLKSPQASG